MPSWLKDAVFYEIYPQSFYDSNSDGIGDIPGIIQKLDYIQNLGCNALWLNPIYDSPFWDAGYDIREHTKVAPRYGTNEDLSRLFRSAHERKIRVLLDLAPGHTSIDHPWFVEAKKAAENHYSGRYIFTRSVWDSPPGYRWVSGITERDGNFLVNFFSTQPALNYGFHNIDYPEWQNPPNHPDCKATLEALTDIMRFWLDSGADGFRVDMADSLVKNDEEKIGTARLWRSVREMLDREYPDAAMVSEWSSPELAINMAGFHMDFYLDHRHNGYHNLVRRREGGVNRCYVANGAPGDIALFTDDYVPKYEHVKENGYISFLTCNHDTSRLTRYLGESEIKLAYCLIFTMPGVPFLYYGDEIGLRFVEGLPSKEGGYDRTGSRTPMQWAPGKNLGFSEAAPASLYLPIDSNPGAPTVSSQQDDPCSILNTVKTLIALRRRYADLNADGDFAVIRAERGNPLFVYRRGSLFLFSNPGDKKASMDWDMPEALGDVIFTIGRFEMNNGQAILSPQSFAIVNTQK
ncbi:MAG: alpha-amylase family glycosyl hydrolase [Oscillospiraceae bacterium]|nr:alpha-amylase family glycosyl hydrolase [Oscillospiraceae bacterium]